MPRSSQVHYPESATPLQISPTRSLILAACGAAFGLLVAGFGLFTAKGTVSNGVPPEDVGLVNQRPLLLSDFEAQIQTVYAIPVSQATPAQKHRVLNDMIREELFVQRGLELDIPSSDPDTRVALVAAVEQQVEADVTASNPTDAQLEDYFRRHSDKYSSQGLITAIDLTAPAPGGVAPAWSAAAVQALRAGAPIDVVSANFGLRDSQKTKGQQFYFAAKILLGPQLFAAAVDLPVHGVSNPILAPDGVHILVVQQNIRPAPMSFADAREQVVIDYKRDEQTRLQAEDERYLRSKADVRLARGYN